jgi:hypothetical protein
MAQHPTKAMISAYRALDAAYSKTHGRCCCTYRHGPWECPFVCQLCSKHAHEPWFMRAVHKPRFILAFRISRTTGTADHGLCTRFGFVNHDLCLFQRALLSSEMSMGASNHAAPRTASLKCRRAAVTNVAARAASGPSWATTNSQPASGVLVLPVSPSRAPVDAFRPPQR